MLLVFNTTV